ncbi:hypothetical protein CK203_042451 [Vitis vinifera]|uniref:Uncharacterized protein n=1 Tax=Vitis vinifera TaxID=29760 RepID=A0A438HEV6_VITVI|nr:hypothetical protein CK203_042451 [Vitis vinifera]
MWGRCLEFFSSGLLLQVSCGELKRADHVAFPLKGSKMKDEANESVSAGLSYSIEIKDAYIPPWIISNMYGVVMSHSTSKDASYEYIMLKNKCIVSTSQWGLLYKFGFKNASAVVLTVVEGQQGAPAMVLLSQH